MSTAKSLQKPKIFLVESSVMRIGHPDVSSYPRTFLGAQIAAAGTAMSVLDNNSFEDNDWMIVGEIGDEKTETTDVNGAVTRGTAMTVTNHLKFSHEVDAPVTRILERGIKIYGAATDGGAGTLISSIDAKTASGTQLVDAVMIQWDKSYTDHNLITTDTAYAFYYATYTDGTTESAASDYIASTGIASNSAQNIIENALDLVGTQMSEKGEVTPKFLIRAVQDWQDYVTQWVNPKNGIKKDWSFEYITDDTSLAFSEMEDEYALSGLTSEMKYGETKQSVLNIRMGSFDTDYIPIDVFDLRRHGVVRTTVGTAGISASATSIVLTNTYEFPESGTVTIGADTITYTGNTEATGTLTGCTNVDNNHSAGAAAFSAYSGGKPFFWTIYNGVIKWLLPPDSNYAGYPMRIKYIKKLTAISDFTDTTEIPFFNTAQYYVAYKVEMKRGNMEEAMFYKNQCDQMIMNNAMSDMAYATESYGYYNFRGGLLDTSRNQDWNSDVTYNY